jgi:hypothetical protein
MPRSQNSSNKSNYHYLLKKYNDADRTELIEERYFKTQKEINELYGLNRSSIYFIINPDNSRLSKKWKEFEIEKLMPPIPVYNKIEAIPHGILSG